MQKNPHTTDEEVSLLFTDVIAKLDMLDAQTKTTKKEIINCLAKNLESKISLDSICIEIVTQLQGRVSARFIHECLDEKYKQKHRVENAYSYRQI